MSWHRFHIIQYDDDCTEKNFAFRCTCPRKSALKKPHCEFKDCKRNRNKEYKNKKVCTFKPCEPCPILHSTLEHSPCCSGDRTRNKRINTDCVCVLETDNRITKKRSRFTEASGVRSPCSILSLQSKRCHGNPYIIHRLKHSGVECECHQNEAEASRANARHNKKQIKISNDRCPQLFCKPTCEESTICNPGLTCANDLPCTLDKGSVHRKCRNTKTKKKSKNKKTGGDACMCTVDAKTSTNGKSLFSKTIKSRTRECCPFKWNPKTCASYNDPCCKYYVDEATSTKGKSCCSKDRPRSDEYHPSNCCQNICTDPCVDFIDEATGTNNKTKCSNIIRPRIPGCRTTSARIPECQKLTPIIFENQHSKWSKKICETCDALAKRYVDEEIGTNDISGSSKMVRPRKPGFQILTPRKPKYQNSECNKIRSHACTDHCEFYKDSATDTLKKAGCFKVLRPRLRECRKPKWYDKLKKKSYVGCDYYKDVSTSTKPKSRCWKSKVIRPKIHECQYSRWNCFGKTDPCTCCVDNAEICQCQKFKWQNIFRRKSKPCTAVDDTCVVNPECQRVRNPCIRYVNVEDECGRTVSPMYVMSDTCIENNGQSALTQAREIMIKSTAVTPKTSKILLGPSNKCGTFDIQCRTDPCGEVYYEHTNSRKTNCDVETSPSLLHALLKRRTPCAKCSNPCGTQQCLKCRVSNCLQNLLMGSIAVCCAPCFLIAISYWVACYLFTNDCKKAGETFRIPNSQDVRFQGGNCNGIQRKCLDPCSSYSINDDQDCIFTAPPGYTIEFYNDKAINTGNLPNPCPEVILTPNDEGNICKKKNKIRISNRCKKNTCPNPQRKYNLYYVNDRGWVIKPIPEIPERVCGGGDNNLNPDTCSSPKRINCDRVNCNSTGPNKCSIQKILDGERLNYEDPYCNSWDPEKCLPEKIFCENYECDYEDCDPLRPPYKTFCDTEEQDPCENSAEPETVIYCEGVNYQEACSSKPLCPPQKTFCDTEEQDPCEISAEPETVIYCEGLNYQDACCSNSDPHCPSQNRVYCEKVKFQEPCACYYCNTSTDCRLRSSQPCPPNDFCTKVRSSQPCRPNDCCIKVPSSQPCQPNECCIRVRPSQPCRPNNCCIRVQRSSQPWRPNNSCICSSDCECPKISFWKLLFCKSKTGNKSQMQGSKYYQSKKGNSFQKATIGNKSQIQGSKYYQSKEGNSYQKATIGNKSQIQGSKYYQSKEGSSFQKTKKGNSYQKAKMKSSYEKSKIGSGYNRPIMRSQHNKFKLGSSYQKSKLGSLYQQSKRGGFYQRSKLGGSYHSKMGSGYRRYISGNYYGKSIKGWAHSKSKRKMLSFWSMFNCADENLRFETDDACRELEKEIGKLQPSLKQAVGDFFRSACRIFKYILVTCCCCPVFFCVYCCHVCCYSMYCKVIC